MKHLILMAAVLLCSFASYSQAKQSSQNIALDNACAAGGTATELAALFGLAKLFVA